MGGSGMLNSQLSKPTGFFGLRLWVVIGIGVGVFIVFILFLLSVWLASSRRRRKSSSPYHRKFPPPPPPLSSSSGGATPAAPPSLHRIPAVSKEIKEVVPIALPSSGTADSVLLTISDKTSDSKSDKVYVHVGFNRRAAAAANASTSSAGSTAIVGVEMGGSRRRNSSEITEESSAAAAKNLQIVRAGGAYYSDSPVAASTTTTGSHGWSGDSGALVENLNNTPTSGPGGGPSGENSVVSRLGWGHWFTLRDLEAATCGFSPDNVLGEGGYGIVYRGCLGDGTPVAVKSLLNNSGQAEKEFRVEVEAIGRVRHKNLVRLLGYCVEINYRMLVYEYVDNGNLEQWLHGPASILNSPTWEVRMKIALGTAKALAYLHEALEPKVVHRDIKASNILLDAHWNAKISDFGLAKLLGSDNSHVKTRVMGTFGYVAPEYANTGLLNERSDVYSFGVLLMEMITGRDPVDYSRPSAEVNLVDWVKLMVASRRSEEVADSRLDAKPSTRALKRALLVALRCVDPDAIKRPKMGYIVHMLESDDFPYREETRLSSSAMSKRTDFRQEQMSSELSEGMVPSSSCKETGGEATL
ncbi:probable receptor-like serine/threonine-protein kinase At4g34500 [Selaginella moellendorffii]|uniref:probable receptor-like serine/threonine-protein kinase At4g34500 n=1 Tax=Selaginella moellendorffii TaxID=88036 RepID=UPI000D1C35E2|nr:probable receptor-like serine/threonine-protein kinase At4g34500 [Selaginella moellendorffii]|eukprot:XP_024538817.1 probable receptor-like serine/threonine-protein kinase At4g34500 [Selaginella moellendorffii]